MEGGTKVFYRRFARKKRRRQDTDDNDDDEDDDDDHDDDEESDASLPRKKSRFDDQHDAREAVNLDDI